jgi:hypothetical protein
MSNDRSSDKIPNKEKGDHFEILTESRMMSHMENYEREVVHGGRRLDFVISNRDGVPQAIVEVKSGAWKEIQQGKDQIDLAQEITERKMLIVATRSPSLDEQFGQEIAQELRDYANERGVRLVNKDISVLENWEPFSSRKPGTPNDA